VFISKLFVKLFFHNSKNLILLFFVLFWIIIVIIYGGVFLNLFNFSLQSIISNLIYLVPVLLISFPIHELSHALVAYKLGDDTAKRAGRLTLNPLKHLDPFGTILLLLVGFGWAKPVPINPLNFKNRREGMALTAVAGPVSNLLLATISLLLFKYFAMASNSVIYNYFMTFLDYMVYINVTLAIFNLIPINPLDGSRILAMFLPQKLEFALYKYERIITLVLFLVLFTGIITGPLTYLIQNVIENLVLFANHLPGNYVNVNNFI
jgi:Zn-dependent protease